MKDYKWKKFILLFLSLKGDPGVYWIQKIFEIDFFLWDFRYLSTILENFQDFKNLMKIFYEEKKIDFEK